MKLIKTAKEYLEFVKNGLTNGDKILEALWVSAELKKANAGSVITEEAIAEIMRRKDICASCSFNSENAKKERGYSDPAPLQGVTHCTLCQCRIGYDNSKEYCLSCNCGIEQWNIRNPDKPPMKLKWEAFVQPDVQNK